MAAKCNIIGLVINKLYSYQYGTRLNVNNNAIVENYAEFVACPCISLIVCNESDCDPNKSNLVVHDCTTSILKIEVDSTVVVANKTTFKASASDPVTGNTFQWTYNSLYFEGTGVITTLISSVTLIWKPAFIALSYFVTDVKVKMTDKDGCIAEKTCAYTYPNIMRCSPYVSCYNVNGLVVSYLNTPCITSSNLVVAPI